MSRRTRPSEQAKALLDSLDRLKDLQRDLPDVIDRLRDWAAGASSGGSPHHGGVSDPTGNQALAVDEWAMARQRLGELIDRVHAASMDLEAIRRDVMTPAPPKAPEDRGLVQCCNIHGCPDDRWAAKAGRCDACYQFNRRRGHDRRTSKDPSAD